MQTAATSPRLPDKGSIVSSIRHSCKDARVAANIEIPRDAIERLLKSPLLLSTFQRLSSSHGLAMPLRFPDALSEVNVLSVLSMLNFAHSYRVPLKKATGRGAYDTMRALIFGLYLSSNEEQDLLSAKGLKNLTSGNIADLMQLTAHIHIEKRHPTIPGLTIGELGGPIHELVNAVTGVLNETGTILVKEGFASLGDFVLDALKKAKISETGPVDPEIVLDRIIRTFPAFQDAGEYNGKPIYVYKKALFLLHALVIRFGGDESTQQIPLPDTSQLPIYSDNVIPSMLVHFGVLNLTTAELPKLRSAFGTPSVAENLHYVPTGAGDKHSQGPGGGGGVNMEDAEGPELSEQEAYVLRAAAVDACELIVEEARKMDVVVNDVEAPGEQNFVKTMDLPGIDGWLWSVAKEGRLRKDLSRFRQGGICIMY